MRRSTRCAAIGIVVFLLAQCTSWVPPEKLPHGGAGNAAVTETIPGEPAMQGRPIDQAPHLAILQTEPAGVAFYPGFESDGKRLFRSLPANPGDGRYAMRIGSGDVRFLALPVVPDAEFRLRLVVITPADDPGSRNVPVY